LKGLKPGDIVQWYEPEPVEGKQYYRKMLILKGQRLLVLVHDDPAVIGITEHFESEAFQRPTWVINPEQH